MILFGQVVIFVQKMVILPESFFLSNKNPNGNHLKTNSSYETQSGLRKPASVSDAILPVSSAEQWGGICLEAQREWKKSFLSLFVCFWVIFLNVVLLFFGFVCLVLL